MCAVLVGHWGLGRFYLVTCRFLALRVEISLVHDDLTRQTIPKPREEPVCPDKLCLNRDICVCCPGRPQGTWPLLPSDVSLSGTPGRDFARSRYFAPKNRPRTSTRSILSAGLMPESGYLCVLCWCATVLGLTRSVFSRFW